MLVMDCGHTKWVSEWVRWSVSVLVTDVCVYRWQLVRYNNRMYDHLLCQDINFKLVDGPKDLSSDQSSSSSDRMDWYIQEKKYSLKLFLFSQVSSHSARKRQSELWTQLRRCTGLHCPAALWSGTSSDDHNYMYMYAWNLYWVPPPRKILHCSKFIVLISNMCIFSPLCVSVCRPRPTWRSTASSWWMSCLMKQRDSSPHSAPTGCQREQRLSHVSRLIVTYGYLTTFTYYG